LPSGTATCGLLLVSADVCRLLPSLPSQELCHRVRSQGIKRDRQEESQNNAEVGFSSLLRYMVLTWLQPTHSEGFFFPCTTVESQATAALSCAIAHGLLIPFDALQAAVTSFAPAWPCPLSLVCAGACLVRFSCCFRLATTRRIRRSGAVSLSGNAGLRWCRGVCGKRPRPRRASAVATVSSSPSQRMPKKQRIVF